MYAAIVESSYRPGQEAGEREHQQALALMAAQPGYRGALMLDAGEGRRLAVSLWESAAARQAATADPAIRRFMAQLAERQATPTRLVAAGAVTASDLGRR
jgi:heme-degrading monooxygenase HmoA